MVSIRPVFAAAALLGLLLLWTSPVGAVESDASGEREEITLSPATTQLSSQPGDIEEGSFKVINTGQTTFEYTLYARPYSVDTQAYDPNYSDTTERGNVYRWVQFDTTSGTLKPGEEQEVNYTILIPDDTIPGGHYSVLFAETVPAEDEDAQFVVRTKRVGSVVRLTVGGDIDQQGRVVSQSIARLQFRPPLVSSALVENTGNVDYDAETRLTVKTVFGKQLYDETKAHVIYPDKPRQIERTWDNPAIIGLYRVEQTVTVLGQSSTESKLVLIMPRWALILLVILVLIGGIHVASRRR